VLKAVRGLSFSLEEKTTLGIVGESGCGKSLTALSIMRLVPAPNGFVEKGEIVFNGKNLLSLPEKEMQKIRGGAISLIFQDPMTSLNPVFTCGMQIMESIFNHLLKSTAEALDLTHKILKEVGINDTDRVVSSYPHQLSGGMRQRVMIAMALVCSPKLLIADEPTTALDVTVQARILDLLHNLQQSKDMSMIMITHNLGIVGDIAHNVMVMYAGLMMEYAPVGKLFETPLHPYTVNLLETVPHLNNKKSRLTVIPGEVPTLSSIPSGCPFHPRCSRCMDKCKVAEPQLTTVSDNHQVRCFLYE
jgi:oligopeptide/dipeptide ABC transporter ATP-binding protein